MELIDEQKAETQLRVEFLHLLADNVRKPSVEEVDEILDMPIGRVVNRINYLIFLLELQGKI